MDDNKLPTCKNDCDVTHYQKEFEIFSILRDDQYFTHPIVKTQAIFYNATQQIWSPQCSIHEIGGYITDFMLYKILPKRVKLFEIMKTKNITTFWLPFIRDSKFDRFKFETRLGRDLQYKTYHKIKDLNSENNCLIYDIDQEETKVDDCNGSHAIICLYTNINENSKTLDLRVTDLIFNNGLCDSGWSTTHLIPFYNYCYKMTAEKINGFDVGTYLLNSIEGQTFLEIFANSSKNRESIKVKFLENHSNFDSEKWKLNANNSNFTNWFCSEYSGNKDFKNQNPYVFGQNKFKWSFKWSLDNYLTFYEKQMNRNYTKPKIFLTQCPQIDEFNVKITNSILFFRKNSTQFPLKCFQREISTSIINFYNESYQNDSEWKIRFDPKDISSTQLWCEGLTFPFNKSVQSNIIVITLDSLYRSIHFNIFCSCNECLDVVQNQMNQSIEKIIANKLNLMGAFKQSKVELNRIKIEHVIFSRNNNSFQMYFQLQLSNNNSKSYLALTTEVKRVLLDMKSNESINDFNINLNDFCNETQFLPRSNKNDTTLTKELCIDNDTDLPLNVTCLENFFSGCNWSPSYSDNILETKCNRVFLSSELTNDLHKMWFKRTNLPNFDQILQLLQNLTDFIPTDGFYLEQILKYSSYFNEKLEQLVNIKNVFMTKFESINKTTSTSSISNIFRSLSNLIIIQIQNTTNQNERTQFIRNNFIIVELSQTDIVDNIVGFGFWFQSNEIEINPIKKSNPEELENYEFKIFIENLHEIDTHNESLIFLVYMNDYYFSNIQAPENLKLDSKVVKIISLQSKIFVKYVFKSQPDIIGCYNRFDSGELESNYSQNYRIALEDYGDGTMKMCSFYGNKATAISYLINSSIIDIKKDVVLQKEGESKFFLEKMQNYLQYF